MPSPHLKDSNRDINHMSTPGRGAAAPAPAGQPEQMTVDRVPTEKQTKQPGLEAEMQAQPIVIREVSSNAHCVEPGPGVAACIRHPGAIAMLRPSWHVCNAQVWPVRGVEDGWWRRWEAGGMASLTHAPAILHG